MLRRRFLVFGEKIESLESVTERYIPVCIAMLRIPTGRRNEYEERYIVVDGKLNALTLHGRVKRGEAMGSRRARLGDIERKLLAEMSGRKTTEIESIARKNGIPETAAFNAIDRLEGAGVIAIEGNKVVVPDRSRLLSHGRPELVGRVVGAEDVSGKKVQQKDVSNALGLAFPLAAVSSMQMAYMPFYEINLRMHDLVRVFRIDAIFGKELDIGTF